MTAGRFYLAFLCSVVYNTVQNRGRDMKTVTFTEFRKHASGLLSDVEKGETILVVRHGRPIAEVSPISSTPETGPSWKRPGPRLEVKGVSLSAAILEERACEDVL